MELPFVHAAADPADPRRAVDIFLPSAEIAFAGHPTIGAAVALPPLRRLVPRNPRRPHRHRPSRAARRPRRRPAPRPPPRPLPPRPRRRPPPHQLPAHPRIRDLELDAPICSIVKGVSFVLTELPDLDLLDDGWQTGFLGRYYYVRTAARDGPDGLPVVCLRARMIERSFEDPAACCLAAFLSSVKDKQTAPTRRYEVTQSVEMGRESNIVVDVAMKDPDTIDTVKLAGSAVEVMRGRITV